MFHAGFWAMAADEVSGSGDREPELGRGGRSPEAEGQNNATSVTSNY